MAKSGQLYGNSHIYLWVPPSDMEWFLKESCHHVFLCGGGLLISGDIVYTSLNFLTFSLELRCFGNCGMLFLHAYIRIVLISLLLILSTINVSVIYLDYRFRIHGITGQHLWLSHC